MKIKGNRRSIVNLDSNERTSGFLKIKKPAIGSKATIGMTTDKKVWYKLALSWGVYPVMSEKFTSADVMFYHSLQAAKKTLNLSKGDSVILTGGMMNGNTGNTNIIKVENI